MAELETVWLLGLCLWPLAWHCVLLGPWLLPQSSEQHWTLRGGAGSHLPGRFSEASSGGLCCCLDWGFRLTSLLAPPGAQALHLFALLVAYLSAHIKWYRKLNCAIIFIQSYEGPSAVLCCRPQAEKVICANTAFYFLCCFQSGSPQFWFSILFVHLNHLESFFKSLVLLHNK